LEPPLCVVSNWIKRVYTILVWNTISGSSNLDICCYHYLILTLIFHLEVLINFFFFIIFIIIIIIIITIIITTTTTSIIIIIVIVIVIVVTIIVVLLLLIIYTINLPVVRPRSCRVIYYFDTPALERRHQSFGHVNDPTVGLKVRFLSSRYTSLGWLELHFTG
jgi:hypothetical protein